MIDTSDWKYFYKISPGGNLVSTNVMYTCLVNPEETMMCMLWDETSPYQAENTALTADLINFFFKREVENIQKFAKYEWCPTIHEIDTENRKIIIEWNKETFNNVLADSNRTLDQVCPDWQKQIFEILTDVRNSGYYKMALYPHCFFLGIDGKIKTFDFYSCVSMEERYIPRSDLKGMIGDQSGHRFEQATVGDRIDFKVFFRDTLTIHLANYWPTNPFPTIHELLYK